ncbi:hypothetical protein PQ469_12430 [Mucilaginibacter sp. KACC 22773]|uniref:hypothetical protein n=1 Tax=Mucilaginibacter sp. KACC 22773 TaxID=3025671 RepID=UPI0023667A41|nr:hypothetical protein [Mucilaginibacter sp. KACC 22773]WDF80814.1 hypothetical protein PQ469_12430 [Mucilaginibacter sp. KACC 22773]
MILNKLNVVFLTVFTAISITACNQQKAKPQAVSADSSKSTVQVNGKKDSVLNNPQKKYGIATASDPCVKCLLQVIHESKSFKANTASLSPQDINYTVNWVKAADPALQPDTSNKTNAVRVDVKKIEDGEDKVLCSYVYNNVNGTMYLINNQNKLEHAVSSITPDLLKKIRNSCYWGVASGR